MMREQRALYSKSRCNCIHQACVSANANAFPVVLNTRDPTATEFVPADPAEARGVVGLCLRVLHVFLARRLAQVRPSVVCSSPISVVDVCYWPPASHVEESEPVRPVLPSVHANENVAISVDAPSYLAGLPSVLRHVASIENPGGRIVVDDLPKASCCNFRFSHAALSFKEWGLVRADRRSSVASARSF